MNPCLSLIVWGILIKEEVMSAREQMFERKMILTLPEKQRLALLLAVQGDQSNAEIAAILSLSKGAAEQLLVWARRRLRALVAEQEVVA
jgi:DNA-directed RNA polymerase specialized sigma24 family protein